MTVMTTDGNQLQLAMQSSANPSRPISRPVVTTPRSEPIE